MIIYQKLKISVNDKNKIIILLRTQCKTKNLLEIKHKILLFVRDKNIFKPFR